jgi:O-acetyl-ADP-ribose deacetylase
MADKIDLSFAILQTEIHVLYADITRLQADVLVSSDDVHFSRTGGVAAAIRTSGGSALQDDLRKHSLPIPIGSVLATTGGQLSAKYIFHAATTEFNARSRPELVLSTTMQRILDLASALHVKRLAMPVLLANRSNLPKAQLLEIIVRSAACHLVSNPSSLLKIMIAFYRGDAADHAEVEKKLLQELEPTCALIAEWNQSLAPLNARLSHLQPLLASISADDDSGFKSLIDERIAIERRELCRLFDCDASSKANVLAPANQDSTPRSQREYERDESQLSTLLADLAEETNHLSELQRARKKRLHLLERQQAQAGHDTRPEVAIEIEEINRALAQIEQTIRKIKAQEAAALQDLEMLRQRWQRQARSNRQE